MSIKHLFFLIFLIASIVVAQDATSLFEEAHKYFYQGDFSKAKSLYYDALKKAEKEFNDTSEIYAVYLSYYANALFKCKEYKLAEEYYLKAIRIAEKYINDNPDTYIVSMYNLSLLYAEIGRYTESEKITKDLLCQIDINSDEYKKLYSSLIVLYQKMNQQSKADSLLSALAENTSFQGIDLANHLNMKGINEYSKGNLKNAVEYIHRALQIFEKEVGTGHPFYSDLLNNVATVYKENNENDLAEKYYLKSVEIKKGETDFNLSFFIAITNLAKFYCDIRNDKKAEGYFDEVNNSLNRMLYRYFPWLTEKEKFDFWNLIKVYTDWYYSFGLNVMELNPGIKSKMLDYQLFTKAILLNSMKQVKEGIFNSNNRSLINCYDRWILEKRMLDNGAGSEQQNNQTLSEDSLKLAVKNLERNISEIGQQYLDTNRISWQNIRDCLSDDEAAIEIARISYSDAVNDKITQYLVFIVKKHITEPEIILIRNGAELETRYYKNYINHLKQTRPDIESYRNYLLPIASSLTGIKKLYISPDGIFNQINLSTLLIDTSKSNLKYLIDSIEVISVSNIKQIIKKNDLSVNEKRISNAVLIGNPDFDVVLNQEKTGRNVERLNKDSENRYFDNLTSLEGSQNEIDVLDSLLTANGIESRVFTKISAEERVMYVISNPSILHIATHGFFLNDLTHRSEKFLGIRKDELVENPLLRSGLCFAGIRNKNKSNFRINDGIFTANDAVNLKLNETELVVLSACETGRGEVVVGEGVYGLLRAFQVAGAKKILASLWKIDDYLTYKMMSIFYKNLIQTNDIVVSIRQAQLEIKENYPQPYYWGAFLIISD